MNQHMTSWLDQVLLTSVDLIFYRCWKSLKINYSLNKHEFFQKVNIIHFAFLWLFIYINAEVDGLIVPFGVMQDQDEQICILAHQLRGATTGSLDCFFNNFNVCVHWGQNNIASHLKQSCADQSNHAAFSSVTRQKVFLFYMSILFLCWNSQYDSRLFHRLRCVLSLL